MTVTPELLEDLVDDAGLFPPEQLPMGAAVARHRADSAAGHLMLTDRFLCPASRIGELRAVLDAGPIGPDPLRVGLIIDTWLEGVPAALAELAAEPRCSLEGMELPTPSAAAVAEALAALSDVDVPVFLEGPREPGVIEALAQWAGPALRGAKVRCGGARPELFPSPEDLAAFVHVCWVRTVPFKATAGLHRAVRAVDERSSSFSARRSGWTGSSVEYRLYETDSGRLAAWAHEVSPGNAKLARSLLVAYGSCSTSEPREEAGALGLLAGSGP